MFAFAQCMQNLHGVGGLALLNKNAWITPVMRAPEPTCPREQSLLVFSSIGWFLTKCESFQICPICTGKLGNVLPCMQSACPTRNGWVFELFKPEILFFCIGWLGNHANTLVIVCIARGSPTGGRRGQKLKKNAMSVHTLACLHLHIACKIYTASVGSPEVTKTLG